MSRRTVSVLLNGHEFEALRSFATKDGRTVSNTVKTLMLETLTRRSQSLNPMLTEAVDVRARWSVEERRRKEVG